MNADGTRTDSFNYKWVSDTAYVVTQYDIAGKVCWIYNMELSSNFRDKAWKGLYYDEHAAIVFAQKYENIIDAQNRIVKSIETNLLSQEITEEFFSYFKFDAQNNPTEIHISKSKDRKPREIAIRYFEYY
ncbi:MAG: hypothetical protein SGJ10_13970 [Bacteroidota bacterium]|nr:hypothetical protein [Bacteroidota bacterium]